MTVLSEDIRQAFAYCDERFYQLFLSGLLYIRPALHRSEIAEPHQYMISVANILIGILSGTPLVSKPKNETIAEAWTCQLITLFYLCFNCWTRFSIGNFKLG